MQVSEQAATQEPTESLRQYYARQLMQPEWLTDIPEALCSEWSVELHALHACNAHYLLS